MGTCTKIYYCQNTLKKDINNSGLESFRMGKIQREGLCVHNSSVAKDDSLKTKIKITINLEQERKPIL